MKCKIFSNLPIMKDIKIKISVAILLLTSCGSKNSCTITPTSANNNAITINIDNAINKECLLFSDYFETPDVIVLETNDKCIIQNIQHVELFEGNIYILDDKSRTLCVFNMNGTFLYRIGDIGNGKGEHIELSDFAIDRKDKKIYLWDEATDKANVFDIDTKDYIYSIKTEREGSRSYYILYHNNKLYTNHTLLNNDDETHLLREIDCETGKQIATYLNCEEYNKGWNFPLRMTNSCFYSKNTTSPKYVDIFGDTILSILPDRLIPAYVVESKDFVSTNDIEVIKKDMRDTGMPDLTGLYEQEKVFMVHNIMEMDSMLYFQYKKGMDKHYMLYDITKKIGHKSNIMSNDYICKKCYIPTDVRYSGEEGVLAVMAIEHIPHFIEHIITPGLLNPEIDDYKKLINLNSMSNPVLFLHKQKYIDENV